MRLVALTLLLSAIAAAQDGIVEFTSWKMQLSDNPAYAQPDFDDAAWPSSTGPKVHWIDQPGWRWYRSSALVPAGLRLPNPVIGLGPINEVYEVYVEGRLVGRFGRGEPQPAGPVQRCKVFALSPELTAGRRLHVAIRVWLPAFPSDFLELNAGGIRTIPPHQPAIGSRETIQLREDYFTAQGRLANLPLNLTNLLMLLAAGLSLALYSTQARHRQYLVLALLCASPAFATFLSFFMAASEGIPHRSAIAVLLLALAQSSYVFASLLLAELCPRYRHPMQAVAWLMVAMTAIVVSGYAFQWGWAVAFQQFEDLPTVPAFLLACWGLWHDGRRGSLFILLALMMSWMSYLGVNTGLVESVLVPVGLFQVDPRSLLDINLAFTTLIVLYLRFRDAQFKQLEAEQELAAGQRAQQLLLQQEGVITPGFLVECSYLPAREVGGDFYQVIPRANGELLVVVGDVSGKGLEAAMLGATLLGALRTVHHLPPGQVLAALNTALVGHSNGRFVTCCCALFSPGDLVSVANAGHPAPYAEGRELDTEPGLPLGIAPGVDYEVSAARGRSFTFVSDGVVEAENSNRELFGFDRTKELSHQSATEIAQAAKAWGQTDDITVVTVRRSR
jgi:phosphoserine phosphatase RsbU/P